MASNRWQPPHHGNSHLYKLVTKLAGQTSGFTGQHSWRWLNTWKHGSLRFSISFWIWDRPQKKHKIIEVSSNIEKIYSLHYSLCRLGKNLPSFGASSASITRHGQMYHLLQALHWPQWQQTVILSTCSHIPRTVLFYHYHKHPFLPM